MIARTIICALVAVAAVVWMAVYLLPFGVDLFSAENMASAFRAFLHR